MAADAQTDEELMDAYVADGDEKAFRQLFERYRDRLFRALVRRIGDEAVAGELVQQTFLQFHRARNDFDAGSEVRPWLYTIAYNLARDYGRKASTRREFAHDELDERPGENRNIRRMEDARMLGKALDQIDEKHRVVIELHWFEGMSYREISEVLGVSRSAVKVRAHRTYRAMRKFLERDEQRERTDTKM